jgi:hypothetical protein
MLVIVTIAAWPGRDLSRDEWGVFGLVVCGAGLFLLLDIHYSLSEIHDSLVSTRPSGPIVHISQAEAYAAARALLTSVTDDNAKETKILVASFVEADLAGPANFRNITELLVGSAVRGAAVEVLILVGPKGLSTDQADLVAKRIEGLSAYATTTVRMGVAAHRTLTYAPLSVGSTLLIGLYGSDDTNYIDSAIELPGADASAIDRVFSTFRDSRTVMSSSRIKLAAIDGFVGAQQLCAVLATSPRAVQPPADLDRSESADGVSGVNHEGLAGDGTT